MALVQLQAQHSVQGGSWEPFWVGSGSVEPIPTAGMFPNTSSGPVAASPSPGSKVQSFGAESCDE